MGKIDSTVIVQKDKIQAIKNNKTAAISEKEMQNSARKLKSSILNKPKTHDVTTFIELE